MKAPASASPTAEAVAAAPGDAATRKQIRGSSLLLVGRVVSLGVNFAVQVVVIRYLSKTDYGAFAYALSLVGLGASIATFGLDRSITRFIPIYDEQGNYGKVFGTLVLAFGTVASIGLISVVVVYGLLATIGGSSLIGNDAAVSVLVVLILLSPIQALDGLLMGMFAVFSRPRAIFFRKYVLSPSLRLTIILLLVLGHQGVIFLAAGYVASGVLGVALYAVMLHRMLRGEGLLQHFSVGSIDVPAREVLSFTIPLLTSDLVYMAMNTSDVILLGHFGGAPEVAAFRVVSPAATLNQLVMTSFTLLFTPLAARMFARGDRDGINRLYWQTAIWIAVLSFPIFTLTFSLAKPVTETLFGSRYADSATYLALLSFAYYFNAALGFNGLTLKVFGRLRYIVCINLVAALVNVGINLLLIPRYGPLGAAIGTSSTLVVHNLMKQVGLLRGTGVRLFRGSDLTVYATIALGAALLLGLQLLVSPPAYVGFAAAAVVSLVVVGLNRSALRAAETFPELMRFRVVRLIVGA
ncbi:MAG TPA: flippase [Gaiellaceae bacterium]|jgi:O-antigen/teichoic acid export membrane protein|nr:flippase [Gaiellaceae bacterium]